MERIIKLFQEGNSKRNVAEDNGYSLSAVTKIWCKYKINRMIKKRKVYSILVDDKSIRISNTKQYAMNIENVQESK